MCFSGVGRLPHEPNCVAFLMICGINLKFTESVIHQILTLKKSSFPSHTFNLDFSGNKLAVQK